MIVGGSSNVLYNNIVENNVNIGINLSGNDNTLDSNTVTENGGYGIYIYNSNNATIIKNVVTSNKYGIVLQDSHNNNLADNTANENINSGITLYSTTDTNLTDNTANDNSRYGIYLAGSDRNNFAGTTANGNTDGGILIDPSGHNTFNDTIVHGNYWGILLQDQSNWNNFTNTDVSGNAVGLGINNSCNNTFVNLISDSNNNVGISLWNGSSNNRLLGGSASINNIIGIHLENSDENIISEFHADNNKDDINDINSHFGILLNRANHNTISNVTAEITGATSDSNIYGIGMLESSHNTLVDNSVSGNKDGIGIFSGSNHNDLIRTTAEGNTDFGIWLFNTEGNNLTDNIVIDNSVGIGVYSSLNTNISGTYAEDNTYGIYLQSSTGSEIRNNTLNENTIGLGLFGADGGTIVHNYINYSDYYGIYLKNSQSNLIYNNYLNNTYNIGTEEPVLANTWNISKTFTPEGNIIGGSYLAGNFYGSLDNYGFSQTTESFDGIAIIPNIIESGNVDELPLAISPPGPKRPTPPPPPPPTPPEPITQTIVLEPPVTPGPSSGQPVEVPSNSIPKTVTPGGSQSMSVAIWNTQGVSWGPSDYVTLQVWILDSNNRLVGNVQNIQVAADTTIVSGKMKELAFSLQMPDKPGTYTIHFQLWKYENGKWLKIGNEIINTFTVEAKKSALKSSLNQLTTGRQGVSEPWVTMRNQGRISGASNSFISHSTTNQAGIQGYNPSSSRVSQVAGFPEQRINAARLIAASTGGPYE
jgi:parallel beta-helix repeat protein